MTDSEKLEKLISEIQYMGGLESRLAEHLLANGVTFSVAVPGHENNYDIAEMSYNNGYAKGCEDSKPTWIPVSERLPDHFGVFIVAIKEPGRQRVGKDCADFDPFAKTWLPSLWWDKGYKVTHWMPLPEPPK